MYCPHCALHFTGLSSDGRCPYCGHGGEPFRVEVLTEAPAPSETASPETALPEIRASVDPDRTRTEAPRLDPWSRGSIIAGKYELLSRLGAGGFGTVYKVRHIFRKKYYALKVPHAECAREETFRVRFEREIEAMERFVHPDAVMIRDSGVTGEGWPYYTMDFIEGESLREVLQREGRLSVDRSLAILTRVLKVLEIAYSHQIIHRDIKPDNILLAAVGGRERVKVLDFGVAKLLDLVGESGSITHGEKVGTPKYMSPEQITGKELDARSDIFSLGLVLYEMVTGQHPFAELRDPIRVTAALLNREPASPLELVPDLPRSVSDLVLSMLEKRRKRRPGSAQTVLRMVERLAEGVSRVEPVEPVGRLSAYPDVERGPAENLVLRQALSTGERRCFLFFDEKVAFGRSNGSDRGIHNQLLVRCLPCRSKAQDPENWQSNLTISHSVGTVFADGNAVVVEPSPKSKFGIGFGDVRSTRPARISAERFHLSVGERVLELDGYQVARTAETSAWDLTFLADGRPPGVQAPLVNGYSNPSCLIDCIYFKRANNWPLHEYYMVCRTLSIGSSAGASLRLDGDGVMSLHAAVIYEAGEAFLVPIQGEVSVSGPRSTAEAVDPRPVRLAPQELLPLVPGIEISFGSTRVSVDAVTDTDFKTT